MVQKSVVLGVLTVLFILNFISFLLGIGFRGGYEGYDSSGSPSTLTSRLHLSKGEVHSQYHPIHVRMELNESLWRTIRSEEDRIPRPTVISVKHRKRTTERRANVSLWGHDGLNLKNAIRRSFLVSLDSPVVINGKDIQRFLLLSLFEDHARLMYHSSLTILSEFQLFPMEFSYSTLEYHGFKEENAGVYLFVEFPGDGISRFLRRKVPLYVRDEGDNLKENMRYSIGDLDRKYQVILETNGEGVQEALDVERYLTWIALNSMLKNGDYKDEVFFYEDKYKMSIIGWDYDTIWSECRTEAKNLAITDLRSQLLWCPASKLDKILLARGKFWDLYKSILRVLLEKISPMLYCVTIKNSQYQIEYYFDTDEKTKIKTFESEKIPSLDEYQETYCNLYSQRWKELKSRLDADDKSNPPPSTVTKSPTITPTTTPSSTTQKNSTEST